MAYRDIDHRFIEFPEGSPTRAKLEGLIRRKIEIPYSLDWNIAQISGLTERIAPFLVYTYEDEEEESIFHCHGWRRLFHISEHIYRELVLEFFSTVAYDATVTDLTVPAFSFRLGQEERNISVIELAWRVGIYTREETESPQFLHYLRTTLISHPEDFSEAAFWADIAEGVFQPGSAKESTIRSPVLRLLHRLISNSIYHRAGSEKVPTTDLFYLWCLVTPGRNLNLPYALAVYLARLATGSRASSPICGGHFVTCLARSYSLLTGANARDLTYFSIRTLTVPQLESMGILERHMGGGYGIPEVEQVEEAGPSQPRVARRRRAPPPPAQAGPQPEIDIRYLSERVDTLGREVQTVVRDVGRIGRQVDWMGDSLTSFYARFGYEHSTQFPRYGVPGPPEAGDQDEADQD